MDAIVRDHAEGATVAIRVVPRARRTRIAGTHGDAVKVKVAAPPVDGAANAELIRFVARLVGVHRRDVSILHGERSPNKVVLVADMDAQQLRDLLDGEI